jgi:3-methyladenine DNA glycosylase AlkD
MNNTSFLHQDLLKHIIARSGKPTQHTFLDSYVGNNHPRYPISTPHLRATARAWLRATPLTPKEFLSLLSSLIQAPSSTEKTIAGILLDYASQDQINFDPKIYDRWVNHLQGWAEIDALCYGHFKINQVLEHWSNWKKLLLKLNKSKNINKRRASIVLLCKPLTRTENEAMRKLTFQLIDQLKHEKEILITKAISWTLRSMVKFHKKPLQDYLNKNKSTLPAIAVRETMTKLKTGRKSPQKNN